jgi:hypothetical protein
VKAGGGGGGEGGEGGGEEEEEGRRKRQRRRRRRRRRRGRRRRRRKICCLLSVVPSHTHIHARGSSGKVSHPTFRLSANELHNCTLHKVIFSGKRFTSNLSFF